ncbi:MAG: hypothetical protein MR346_02495 [Clostridium sp.]|nr:hypothetical protein [Clostridium sp.]
MKRIINPTIVHSATQPTEKADLWIKALPNNQNTLMIFDNGYENVDSNLTERLNNEAQAREDADIAEANKRLEEDTKLNNRVDKEITDRTYADNALSNRITTNLNSINTINSKIPSQASPTNQLADKEFVNSSIANNAATFQGTFETVDDLPTTNVKNNDYAFIVSVTSEGNPEYKRYKYNGTQWIEEFTLNNSSFTANQWAAINSGITDTWINDTNEKLENITSTTIIEITWSDLKAKRDAGELTLGQLYRITDYQCTTIERNTRSAGHQFDIIVLALSKNTLSEQAYAALHSGDTYFANNNLSAWKLWYCLDNDTTRFAWADSTNGKGVIYRMIDEFNNDVPYDFKNIQFKHPIRPDIYSFYYYTFTNNTGNTDYSLDISYECFSNTIKECISDNKKQLNNIIFIERSCYCNYFDIGCHNNLLEHTCQYNSFGMDCFSNSLSNNCYHNSFGSNCSRNLLDSSCSSNSFGTFCFSNILGESCCYNSFGNDCSYIKFANNSSTSGKYNYYKHNHFGDGCQYILFKGAETASSNAQVQNYNFAQGLQGTSDVYLTVDGVRNRAYETKVAKNSAGDLKIYCEADLVQ